MWDIAEKALEALPSDVTYADVRIIERETQAISIRNGVPERIEHRIDMGAGIRVLVSGAWGFAGTSDLSKDSLVRASRLALKIANASSALRGREVRLSAASPLKARWENEAKIDPFSIPVEEKLELLARCCQEMGRVRGVKVSLGSMDFSRTRKFFVNSEGTRIEQTITISGAGIEAIAAGDGEVQSRSYPSSFRGHWAEKGYELIEELDLVGHSQRVAEESAILLKADPCPSEETDLILDGHQMAIQIHESIGHPLELDRVLGMELSFAGGSFVKVEDLGRLRYGSPLLNISADATAEGGVGSFGYDDEGVPAKKLSLIEGGILKGFLSNRETAMVLNLPSGGTARASGWNRIPMVRMTNINLEPGSGTLEDIISDTKQGVFMASNKSWSIDDRRLNFQFATEIAWEVKNGRLGRVYKNPGYAGITPQFWASLDRVAGPSEWKLWGTPFCGKGQPYQLISVGHGTSPARFRKVRVGVIK